MARKPTGTIIEHTGRDGLTYRSLRFSAYGKRRFVALGAVDREEAEKRLRGVLADVERGVWREPDLAAPEPDRIPTFHEFAEQWWIRNESELRPSSRANYRWRLEKHLLPFFADTALDRITFDLVEKYIATKADLAARSVNATLKLMATILDGAVERELIPRNPAKGKRRPVREREPQRTYLDTADQIEALLPAAAEVDANARAIVATLTFAGLRIGELCALKWRDVDLATGWLHVGESKTDAGRRRVKLRGALRDELAAVRARAGHEGPDNLVFATSRRRVCYSVLAPAVKRANEMLAERDCSPLPERVTPHSLRRTFASVLYALGEDPGVVMDEMGHTDPAFALRVYRQSMRR